PSSSSAFLFTSPARPPLYTLSLHDALPILPGGLVAVLLGTFCGWLLPANLTGVALSGENIVSAWGQRGWFFPIFCGEAVLGVFRSEEHTSELQSRGHLVCRLLLEKKKKNIN